jgi:hypothetical protein
MPILMRMNVTGERRVYVSDTRSHDGIIHNEWDAAHTSTEYIEPDHDTWTGLYDHNGTPLHRQREPIGYQPNRWRTEVPNANQKKQPKTKKKGK